MPLSVFFASSHTLGHSYRNTINQIVLTYCISHLPLLVGNLIKPPWLPRPSSWAAIPRNSHASYTIASAAQLSLTTFYEEPWRRNPQTTPVFLPGESHRHEPGGPAYVGSQKSWTGLKATKQQWRTNTGPSAWQVQGKTVKVQD